MMRIREMECDVCGRRMSRYKNYPMARWVEFKYAEGHQLLKGKKVDICQECFRAFRNYIKHQEGKI